MLYLFNSKWWLLLIGVTLLTVSSCQQQKTLGCTSPVQAGLVKDKMCGMSITAPKNPFVGDPMLPLNELGVKWISCLPYSIFHKNNPTIKTIHGAWWGETNEGVCTTIDHAHSHGIKVMLKPQLWNWEQWIGAFDLETEAQWDTFEQSYTTFIMRWVHLADSMEVDMFCIGTEIKNSVEKRPDFWRGLIDSIRQVYKGKLTYATNWDHYEKIVFWDKLDYIGIDAYFPLLRDTTPAVCDLKEAWLPTVDKLEAFSAKWTKPILFTEFGYLSLDGCTHNTWELEKDRHSAAINQQAQANAVQALLEAFGTQDWWAGGFQWKWYPNKSAALGEGEAARDYTPQDKLCADVLKKMYN